jgi:hypothetical protein
MGSAGSRMAWLLTVENLSPSEWRDEGSRRFRIGVRLHSNTGQLLRELHGVPVPQLIARPGGKGTVLLDLELPDRPGLYEVFLDMVEDTVCWFSERGSPPLVCKLRVFDGPRKRWDYQGLMNRAYRTLLGREPRPEEADHWQKVLEDGGRLEWMLSDLCQAAGPHQSRQIERRLKRLRRDLLADIDALSAN